MLIPATSGQEEILLSPVVGNFFGPTGSFVANGRTCFLIGVVIAGTNVPPIPVSVGLGCFVLGESPGLPVDVSGGLGSVFGEGTAIF